MRSSLASVVALFVSPMLVCEVLLRLAERVDFYRDRRFAIDQKEEARLGAGLLNFTSAFGRPEWGSLLTSTPNASS
jgi:hypothetical protein